MHLYSIGPRGAGDIETYADVAEVDISTTSFLHERFTDIIIISTRAVLTYPYFNHVQPIFFMRAGEKCTHLLTQKGIVRMPLWNTSFSSPLVWYKPASFPFSLQKGRLLCNVLYVFKRFPIFIHGKKGQTEHFIIIKSRNLSASFLLQHTAISSANSSTSSFQHHTRLHCQWNWKILAYFMNHMTSQLPSLVKKWGW